MAENKGNGNETTRRGFLTAVGVGAAALAVPAGATAGAAGGPARFAASSWRGAVAAWPAAVQAMKAQTEAVLAQFRPAYLAEVERLAEGLHSRLSPGGDLHAALGDTGADEDDEQKARDRIEAICDERFGLEVTRHGYQEPEGDAVLGQMICAVSPSAPEWGVDDGDWHHPCYAASACAGSDVLAAARRHGAA